MAAIRNFCLFILVASATAARSAETAWHVTGQVGGPTSAVTVSSNPAFTGVGFRVLIHDVSNPAKPTEVGSTVALPDLVTDISISGSRAFVTAGSAGLRIFDISDVAHPAEIGAWDSPGYAEAVTLAGDRAYVADGPYGLQVLDVSDRHSPRLLSGCFDMNYAYDVVVQEGRAYIAAADAGLLIADVSDPLHPLELAALDTPGYARRIAVADGVAYVADEWGGVRVVAVADPRQPGEIASIALPSWVFGVTLSGTTLFVANGSQGLRAFDITTPASPREASAYPITWQHTGAVTVADGLAYVAIRGQGLHVVDVRNQAAPKRLAVVSQLADARAALAVGDIAYVAAADQGLRVIDLAAGAREIGTVEAGGFAYCAAMLGQSTLIVGSTGINSSGIYFFDITNPRAPRQTGFLTSSTLSPKDLAVRGSLIDGSNPASPVVLSYLDFAGTFPSAPGAGQLALVGSVVSIAQGSAGLVLVDVADPVHPKIAATYKPDSLAHAQALAADGRYAYVAGSSALHVVDISDPRAPQTVSIMRPLNGGEQVRLVGTTLLIAGGAAGLITVDVSDPTQPRVIGSKHLPGFAFGVALAGERILVADLEAGLFLLDSSSAARVPPRWPHSIAGDRGLAAVPVETPPAVSTAELREVLAAQKDLTAGFAKECAERMSASPNRQADAETRTLTVTSAADSGAGTLREILSGVKAGDVVTFEPTVFSPEVPVTIRLSTQLPCLCSDRITIDASGAGVVLDGSAAPHGAMGLVLGSDNAAIKGLQITGFTQGIIVQGAYNVIDGDRTYGAGPTGEGNVISGNANVGVDFANALAGYNRVVGNFIGTDAAGTRPLGRQMIGVMVSPGGPGNVIDGTEVWKGNVISGNTLAEVFLQQGQQTTIVGNLIGTDPTGTRRVGSASMGIGTGGHSSDNIITENVIVASQQGIIISDSGSFYNQTVANRIGIGLDGAPPPPVTTGKSTGVAVSQSYNRIADNVISGNAGSGVVFTGPGPDGNFILGNVISADITGERALGNGGSGVNIGTSDGNFIQDNMLAWNGEFGALVTDSTGNRLRRNAIHTNRRGGIANGDSTGAPAPPVLRHAWPSRVDGTACSACLVEVFSDAGAQGRSYEGATVAAADGTFVFQKAAGLPGRFTGLNVTATATDSDGSTSSFSVPAPVPAPRRAPVPDFLPQPLPSPQPER